MKHIAFLLFVVCVFQTLDAQNWTVGAKWIYWQDDLIMDPDEEYRVFTKEKDTLIQNLVCSKISEKYILKLDDDTNETTILKNYYLYYDDPRVFLVTPSLVPLFDFSKTTGDTILSYCPDANEVMHLLVDSVGIGSYSLRVQFVHPIIAGSCFIFNPIFERVGLLRYFFPQPGFVDPPPGGALLCFADSLLTFGTCGKLLDDTAPPAPAYSSIYPNPTTGSVFIESENFVAVRLFNLFGQLLKTQKEAKELVLNEFPDGVYLLEIQTTTGSVLKKLIKKN